MTTQTAITDAPAWHTVLRALREARNVTQDGWAAHLGVGRRTVQRWEQGLAVPDAAARRAILAYCAEGNLFRRYEAGPLAGITVTAAWLSDLLATPSYDERGPALATPITSAPVPALQPAELPTPLTSLIGREEEIAAVAQLLARSRLVTITGPGGAGKTRLAIAVAERVRGEYGDGVIFVDLAPVTDPGHVTPAIAQALGMVEIEGRSLAAALKAHLRGRRMLLIVDNVEQVVEAAPVLADLLAAAPAQSLLVTSRVLLRVSGEQEYAAPSLPYPPVPSVFNGSLPALTLAEVQEYAAVRLFVERAQAARPGFALTEENAAAVAAICARLDGLPLALELAAARIRVLAPQALLARLQRRLPLLVGGVRDAPVRQHTLRATIAWSYDLLSPAEQALFRCLSVFAGGCTLDAVERICACETFGIDALDGLTSLVEQSLLRKEDGPDGEPRFAMLATIREFGLERLAESGDAALIEERHAAYYGRLAARVAPRLQMGTRATWLALLDAEQENLRAALAWSHEGTDGGHLAVALATDLFWYWRFRSGAAEGRHWLATARALPAAADAATRARLLWREGALAFYQDDVSAAREKLDRGIELAREAGILSDLAYGLIFSVFPTDDRTEAAAALTRTQESITLLRRLGDDWGLAFALSVQARMHWFLYEIEAAAAAYDASQAIFQRLGDEWGIMLALHGKGLNAFRMNDFAAGAEHVQQALTFARRIGDQKMIAASLNNLGVMYGRQKQDDEARALYEEALAVQRRNGAPTWVLTANLAFALLAPGEISRAAALYAEAMAIARDGGITRGLISCLRGLGGVADARGNRERAVQLYAAADRLDTESGNLLDEAERECFGESVEAARGNLSAEAFDAAWQAGRALPLEAAIELALEQAQVTSREAEAAGSHGAPPER